MGALPIDMLREIAERKDALAAKVPTSSFYAWVRGQHEITLSQAMNLARVIGFDLALVDAPNPHASDATTERHCPCCCPHAKMAKVEQARRRYTEDE